MTLVPHLPPPLRRPERPYRIHVLCYARRDGMTREVLLGNHGTEAVPLAYFMWAVSNGEHAVVVDLGFSPQVGRRRGRHWQADPATLLQHAGVDPHTVQHVVVTHLHYDHAGNHALFPQATFWLQRAELAFWTGPHACHDVFAGAAEPSDVVEFVRLNQAGRVALVDGTAEVVPGVRVHRVGGHTAGMQVVEVAVPSGTAVIASDAAHTWLNLQRDLPAPILHDVPGVLDGFALMRALATREALILPGHDAAVMERFPRVAEGVALVE